VPPCTSGSRGLPQDSRPVNKHGFGSLSYGSEGYGLLQTGVGILGPALLDSHDSLVNYIGMLPLRSLDALRLTLYVARRNVLYGPPSQLYVLPARGEGRRPNSLRDWRVEQPRAVSALRHYIRRPDVVLAAF